MQNLLMLLTFFVFEWKYPFWANLVQKIKIFSFCFCSEIPFLGKFVPKSQNYQLKLNFGTQSNSNMQNSVMLFTFFCFSVEIPFLGKLGPKNQNCHFMLKFGTYTNPNMQNSMVMFIFSVFDWKYPFWANLTQKVKIIS